MLKIFNILIMYIKKTKFNKYNFEYAMHAVSGLELSNSVIQLSRLILMPYRIF